MERKPSKRSFLVRHTILWHWVSSGVCLAGMLLFTITGITLNHAAEIAATPIVTKQHAELPASARQSLTGRQAEGRAPLPSVAEEWLRERFALKTITEAAEWSEVEVYIPLPRPGGDAWIAIDRATGVAKFEKTDRGWISYFNDLHKGRHSGRAWQIFIDVLGGACLVFTLTGLVLLQIHASKRPSTWPLVLLGVLTPFLLMLFLVHG